MNKIISLMSIALLFLSMNCSAQDAPTNTDVGRFIIHHSVVGSTRVNPKQAKALGLKVGKNVMLVNLAVTPKDSVNGIAAKVSGSATDSKLKTEQLAFIQVKDAYDVYYLASITVADDEPMTFIFDIEINAAVESSGISENKTENYQVHYRKVMHTYHE